MARLLVRRLRGLSRDECGQSALFAILTLMLLMIVIAYTYNVGMTVSQRVRLQNAADAAAYSGAVVEANALTAIAWLNNCQTYMHAKLQQHMLDVVMYSTATCVAEWGHYTKDHFGGSKDSKKGKHRDRDAYEPWPFLLPNYFIPFPFVAENVCLEENVFGRLEAIGGNSKGYPPADEFVTVFDTLTFKNKLPETTLQDLADQIKANFQNANWLPSIDMKQLFTDAFNNLAGNIGDAILDAVVDTVKDEITKLLKNLVTYMVQGKAPSISVSKIIKNLIDNVVAAVKDAIMQAIKDVIESLADALKQHLMDLIGQLLHFQRDEYSTFQQVWGMNLYERLNRKYDLSVTDPQGVVDATKNYVLRDAKAWIANPNTKKRPGELYIRQLSLAASAIAKALPELVRNEALYSVRLNAPPGTHMAMFPAPDPASGSPYGKVSPAASGAAPVFDGRPALAANDNAAGGAFFRYDAYPAIDLAANPDFTEKQLQEKLETSRFLAESRRQAYAQGMRYVRKKTEDDDKIVAEERVHGEVDSIILKPQISWWWDELEGRVLEEGRKFQGLLRCWNEKDRSVDADQDGDWGPCPIGYAPGRTPGSPMAKPEDADNAADGHWHVKHGHSHGEGCFRWWGGFCIGIYPLPLLPAYGTSWLCLYKCLILEIAYQINHTTLHHMQYLNHQANYHWDGLVESDDNLHVYCKLAVSNRQNTKADEQGQSDVKTQYPDIVPGLRFPKICWMCRFTMKPFLPPPWPWPIPLPDCLATNCPRGFLSVPDPPADPPPAHATAGDPWGVIFEYIPLLPLAWPADNVPLTEAEQAKGWPQVYKVRGFAQNFPGHFWTKMDWEALFSGDRYYYSRKHYLGNFNDRTTALTGYGVPDAILGMLPQSVLDVLYFGLEIRGRLLNWKNRKGHHGFMVCPLCMGNCPVCKSSLNRDWPLHKHWGRDEDGDEQSDVGFTFEEVMGKGGDNSRGHDLDSGEWSDYDLNTDINYKSGGKDLNCARFVRSYWAPRSTSGTAHPELAPTVVLTQNFFKYGLTVALWAPHQTFFFKDFFGERPGHLAVATARAGFVEPTNDPEYKATSPLQIVTGIGESRTDNTVWNQAKVKEEFLDFRSNKYERSNLYYPNWGAKLVSTRYGILPDTRANQMDLWYFLGAAYCYTPDGTLTNSTLAKKVTNNGKEDDWNDFVMDYVGWKN